VLEEPPQAQPGFEVPRTGIPHVLTLSAHNKVTLDALVKAYIDFLDVENNGEVVQQSSNEAEEAKVSKPLKLNPPTDASLQQVCYTSAVKRTHHAVRLSVIGKDVTALLSKLRTYHTTMWTFVAVHIAFYSVTVIYIH
jgi:acyl transferase domain-containing protein